MTVAELIERLKGFPPHLRVVTSGFDESDIDDVGCVQPMLVEFGAGRGGHSGEHKECETGTPSVYIDFG